MPSTTRSFCEEEYYGFPQIHRNSGIHFHAWAGDGLFGPFIRFQDRRRNSNSALSEIPELRFVDKS